MGYHLTISRKESQGAHSIDAREFASAAQSTPELCFDASTGKAEYFRAGEPRATLLHQDGEIWTNVPEPDVIDIMTRLAAKLDAHVFGDEGEWYSEDGKAHFAENAERKSIATSTQSKKKRIIWNIIRITAVP